MPAIDRERDSFMKCPKCGYEWTEGHLYCDNCGEEFRIVPDFEPEIEEEMNETLSTLLVELAQEEMPELEEKGKDKERIKKQKSMPHKVRRRSSSASTISIKVSIASSYFSCM